MAIMNNLFDQIRESCEYIRNATSLKPVIGIVLGSGLSTMTNDLSPEKSMDYSQIPHFPQSTVKGHPGKLIFGKISGVPVMLMAGRFHYYEGYSMQEVTFPIRLMKALGVETLMLSNAAGGLDPKMRTGDLMVLEDHINLMPENPLRGINDERLGVRFPDMSEPYSPSLLRLAKEIAQTENIILHSGVYAGVPGPCFETKAEYRYLRAIGADAVGMSTVPETIVAIHSGIKVFALSVITDVAISGEIKAVSHEEVLDAAFHGAPVMIRLFKKMIERLQTTGTE